MKIRALIDLEAAHDIDDGIRYLASGSFPSLPNGSGGFTDFMSAGLSAGAAQANFPAEQSRRNVEKIRIKNNSLCILCPEYASAHADDRSHANFSRTPGVLFPGDEGEFEFSYIPAGHIHPIFHLTFLVISADSNFTGMNAFPSPNEITLMRINFFSDRFSKLHIRDVTVNGERVTPVYGSGTAPRGEDNIMSYFTYRGTQGSMEPSFGMSYFDVRAASINERNATGTTSLIFTPSGKRSSLPVRQLNNPGTDIWSELAVRNFLRVCLHRFRAASQPQQRSFSGLFSVLGFFQSAIDIYSSISTRTNTRTYLTVNIRNLTGNNMFILRRKHSNSMRMDNGIVLDGETVSIPLSFTSFRPHEPEVFIRIVEGNGAATDLVLSITDFGDDRSIKVSRAHLSAGSPRTQHDPRTDSSSHGVTNCVFNFVSPSGRNRVFIQPTIVTSQHSPTLDVAIVMVENRHEFTPPYTHPNLPGQDDGITHLPEFIPRIDDPEQ